MHFPRRRAPFHLVPGRVPSPRWDERPVVTPPGALAHGTGRRPGCVRRPHAPGTVQMPNTSPLPAAKGILKVSVPCRRRSRRPPYRGHQGQRIVIRGRSAALRTEESAQEGDVLPAGEIRACGRLSVRRAYTEGTLALCCSLGQAPPCGGGPAGREPARLGFRWEQRRGRGDQHGREPASGCGVHRRGGEGPAAGGAPDPPCIFWFPSLRGQAGCARYPVPGRGATDASCRVIGDYGRTWEAAGMAPPGTGQSWVSASSPTPAGPPRMPSPGSAPSRLRLIDLPGGRRRGRHNVMAAAQGDYHEVPGVPQDADQERICFGAHRRPLTWTQLPGTTRARSPARIRQQRDAPWTGSGRSRPQRRDQGKSGGYAKPAESPPSSRATIRTSTDGA